MTKIQYEIRQFNLLLPITVCNHYKNADDTCDLSEMFIVTLFILTPI